MQTKKSLKISLCIVPREAKVMVGNTWAPLDGRHSLFNHCSPCICPSWYKPFFQPIAVQSNEFTVAAGKKQLHSNRNNYMNVTNG